MRKPLIMAWLQMASLLVLATAFLVYEMRYAPFDGLADMAGSLGPSVLVLAMIGVNSAARLRRAVLGLTDPPTPSMTVQGIVGVAAVALAVMLALAPALIAT